MHKDHVRAAASLLLVAAPLFSHGNTERPVVAVTFELRQEAYRQAFPASQRTEIKRQAGANFAAALEDELPFIRFVSAGTFDHKLTVAVGRTADDPANCGRSTCNINFHLTLESPDLRATTRSVPWLFRPPDRSHDRPGHIDVFLKELTDGFKLRLREASQELVRASLSHLPLAHEAFLMETQPIWVLPFSRTQIQVNKRSEFEIETKFNGADQFPIEYQFRTSVSGETPDSHPSVPAPYSLKVMAELIDPDPEKLRLARQALQDGSSLEVVGIYMVRFNRLPRPPVSEPPPSSLDFEEDGP